MGLVSHRPHCVRGRDGNWARWLDLKKARAGSAQGLEALSQARAESHFKESALENRAQLSSTLGLSFNFFGSARLKPKKHALKSSSRA